MAKFLEELKPRPPDGKKIDFDLIGVDKTPKVVTIIKLMPKSSEKGSVFIVLVVFFLVVVSVAAFYVYKTITTSTQKISQNTDKINIALKAEYENPFDKNTQYVNPFSSYQNPFDGLK